MLASYRGRWVFLNPLPQDTSPSEVMVVSLPTGAGSSAAPAAAQRGAAADDLPRAQGARRPSSVHHHSERQRHRRAARALLAAWYKTGGSGDGSAQTTGHCGEGLAAASAAAAAECDLEAGEKHGPGGEEPDDECPICLEPLSMGPSVRVPLCGHSLHCACAEHLVHSGSLSCPVCRASLVPPHLSHLEAILRSSRRPSAGGGQVDMGTLQLAAGVIPGVVARPGAVLTAADWEVESDDDLDVDGDGLEFVLGTPMPWRMSIAQREALMAQLRADAQRATVMRGLCAKMAFGVFVTLTVVVLFLLVGSVVTK